jgi:hypothetical protein
MKRLYVTPALLATSIATMAFLAAQDRKTGGPEDHLPANITQLTAFGERASWSPDGQRIAFMSKSFGDTFVVDVKTKTIRLVTHYPNPGYLRVQYLPNGDFFLIGARTFIDIGAIAVARSGDVGAHSGRQGAADRARAQDLRRRRDFAEDREDRLVEHARPISRPARRGGVGHLHG